MKKVSVRSVLVEMKVIAEDLYQNGVTTDAEDRAIEDWIEGVKKRYPPERRADQVTGDDRG